VVKHQVRGGPRRLRLGTRRSRCAPAAEAAAASSGTRESGAAAARRCSRGRQGPVQRGHGATWARPAAHYAAGHSDGALLVAALRRLRTMMIMMAGSVAPSPVGVARLRVRVCLRRAFSHLHRDPAADVGATRPRARRTRSEHGDSTNPGRQTSDVHGRRCGDGHRNHHAAQHKCDLYSTDTKQAFLYGDMLEDEVVYVKPPDWWFDPIQEGHVIKLKNAIYGTKQAARRWHTKISTWMDDNGYPAVNSEKTIFMKRAGDDFIIHGLFVDDIMTAPTKRAGITGTDSPERRFSSW
jgi:hypothetical protein